MTHLGSLTHSPGTQHPYKNSEAKDAQLLELRMDGGLVYVQPSRWQRMRLLWLFRNFHVLPMQVLSQRDQRLIARLALSAVVTPPLPVTRRSIFGIVEKVSARSIAADNATQPAWKLDGVRSRRTLHMGAVAALTTVCVAIILALQSSPKPQHTSRPMAQRVHPHAPDQVAAVSLPAPIPVALPVATKTRRWVAPPPAVAVPPEGNPTAATNLRLVSELPPGHFAHPVVAQSNLDGEVRLRALIGSDGAVKTVTVLSGDPRLAEASVRAVRKWRYPPYGDSVEMETRVKMDFFGQDAVSIASDTNEPKAR